MTSCNDVMATETDYNFWRKQLDKIKEEAKAEDTNVLGYDEIIKKVRELRSKLPSKLKTSGNSGYESVDIDGLNQNDFFALSSIDKSTSKGALDGMSFIPENPVFKAKMVNPDNATINTKDAYLRIYDSEYKILNDIASKLSRIKNPTGTINLFTERYACQSCSDIIMKFREKFQNIKLNIFTNNDVVVKPNKK